MLLIAKPQKEYELLDSGDGFKLERFGDVVVSRPDPQALWGKRIPQKFWDQADASFVKSWKEKNKIPENWQVSIEEITFNLKLSSFKHVGVFPEQLENWKWIKDKIKKSEREIKVLNLFGYTGGATLASLQTGAEVCHVDGSKVSISLAKENAIVSHVSQKKVRWILDDVVKFVSREIRRGNKYDAVIMDPPAFGRGSKGEVWKIEKDFPHLLNLVKQVLSDKPLFLIVNGYASGYSHISYANSLRETFGEFSYDLESGELAIEESKTARLLPAGIFARLSFEK